MKYTALGSSDLRASRIYMGCMGFGGAAQDSDAPIPWWG